MKRILIVCLLGMGLLLPDTTITAKNFSSKRIVDIFLEDDWLLVSSDSYTGTLVKIEVYNTNEQIVASTDCSGYSCDLDLRSLPSGNYMAHVTTSITYYNEWFSL